MIGRMYLRAGILAILALSAGGTARAEFILNGGFESPVVPPNLNFVTFSAGSGALPGWTIVAGNVDVAPSSRPAGTGFWPAFQGNQSLDLTGSVPGILEQQFTTTPGEAYLLSFAYANNPYGGTVERTANVSVFGAGTLLSRNISHSTSTLSAMDYTLFSGTFVANSSASVLRFTSTGGATLFGVVLDAVSVVAVPEPTSFTLVWLGGMGLMLAGWRRRKANVA